jgi:hypothetical protein
MPEPMMNAPRERMQNNDKNKNAIKGKINAKTKAKILTIPAVS